MNRTLAILPIVALLSFASTATAGDKSTSSTKDNIHVEADGYFSTLDPTTGKHVELGWWDFVFTYQQDVNSGQVFWVEGDYGNGPNEDAGYFTGTFVWDTLANQWTMDLHLICTQCTDPDYNSHVVMHSTDDANVYQGFWWDKNTQSNGTYGYGILYF